jgi:hypothetical protein
LNPTQLYNPFIKRFRSGNDKIAFTTFRSMRRKSRACAGIATVVIRSNIQ